MKLPCNLAAFLAAIFFLSTNQALAQLKSERLQNGLELISFEARKVPLVTIVLAVKAGAFTESPETNGLTHLWEHMFFKGNASLPNQEAFKRKIQDLGIIYNGDTHPEMVRYYFTLPSANLEEGLEFMYQAIATPLIDPIELQKERMVVLDEYDRNASQPSFELYRARLRLIYGPLSYLRDPLGERSVIENASRDQLMAIKDQVFVPGNSALLMAGDFETSKAQDLVKKVFAKWQNPAGWRALKQADFSKFPGGNMELVRTHPHARNINVSLNFIGPKAKVQARDTVTADVFLGLANYSLGRFHKRLIDSGLCFAAGLSYLTQSQAGEMSLWFVSSVENYKQALLALKDEITHWSDPDYFTEQQLIDVRRALIMDRKFSENRPSAYIKDVAFWWAITDLDFYEKYNDVLNGISLEDIRFFSKKYLVNKDFVTAILLSDKDAEKAGLKDNISADQK